MDVGVSLAAWDYERLIIITLLIYQHLPKTFICIFIEEKKKKKKDPPGRPLLLPLRQDPILRCDSLSHIGFLTHPMPILFLSPLVYALERICF
jgi:hypothetical protein